MTTKPAIKFPINTTVRFTVAYLRNTGQFMGRAGHDRWQVVDCQCSLCALGGFVAVNETAYRYGDEGPDASPWRHIAEGNLQAVKGTVRS